MLFYHVRRTCYDTARIHGIIKIGMGFGSRTALILAALLPAVPCMGAPQQGCVPADYRVVLDVGHTERQPGATSARGIPEFRFNLDLARHVLRRLQDDGFYRTNMLVLQNPSLRVRVQAIDELRPSLVLSIHHDSVQPRYLQQGLVDGKTRTLSRRFAGWSLFISRENAHVPASESFARSIGRELSGMGHAFTMHHAENIPGENRPVIDGRLGLFGYDKLFVLRNVAAPAALLEAAVIVNPDDEAKATSAAFRSQIASAVVAAVRHACTGALAAASR